MADWQPIETFLERDDTTETVLIFVPGRGIMTARLVGTLEYSWIAGDENFPSKSPLKYAGHRATHWQPLPEPPNG